MKNKGSVKTSKVVFVTLRSWVSFIFALFLMASVWAGCFLLIARFAPAGLNFFILGAGMAAVVGLLTLIFNEPLVALVMGARMVRNRDKCPKLWDAVRAVTPWHARPYPRIYIVQSTGFNAFAFGWGLPFFSAVGATSALVVKLTKDELEAVMAHEVGHIINRDILVSTAMAISVMTMAFTGWLLLRFGSRSSGSRRSSSKSSIGVLIILSLVGVVLYLFGRLFGVILQLFVSRQREYAADATSASIIGTSGPLISALRKISEFPKISSSSTQTAIGFLCTVDPTPNDMFSTHPSLRERILSLVSLQL